MTSVLHWLAANLHPHLLFYTIIILVLLYRPPKLFSYFVGMADFLSRHFGDSVAFYLVHLGVGLQIIAGVYPQLAHVDHVGESLLVLGVGMLKLKYIPKDGNGNGPPAAPEPRMYATPGPEAAKP
jgi:hypothetical protein